MKVMTCVTQRAGGRTYVMLLPQPNDGKSPGRMAAYVAKSGSGLAKKTPEVAGKLIMEQFPALACVEVRAGSLATKVLR